MTHPRFSFLFTPILLTFFFLISASLVQATTYYVSLDGNDGDGLSWATAKTTIQAAVDLTVDGDTVLVDDGEYRSGGAVAPGASLSNRVYIDRAITLQSVNGAAHTSIRASSSFDVPSRALYLVANATVNGFRIHDSGVQLSIDGGVFSDWNGGGVFIETSGTLNDCVLYNCTARKGSGGGVYGPGILNRCVIDYCRARNGGGACGISPGGVLQHVILNDCVLLKNISLNGDGGGAYRARLNRCRIQENDARLILESEFADDYGGFGGGASMSILQDCVVVRNISTTSSGGLHYCQAYNCTIVNNSSEGISGTVGTGLRNCIIYGNVASVLPGSNQAEYSIFPEPTGGDGNLTGDPQFVNVDTGDFRLKSTSPCLNAGDNAAVKSAVDFDGNLRIVNSTVDMGAFEALPVVTLNAEGGTTTGSGSHPANSERVISVTPYNSHWIFEGWNDGNTDLVRTITVPDHDITYTADFTELIGQVTFHVKPNGNDSNNGLSWDTATRTIQAAVDLALGGDRVLVGDGAYGTGTRVTPGENRTALNRVVITKDILVESVNGPSKTSIWGEDNGNTPSSTRGVYMTSGTLSGFSIRGGFVPALGAYTGDNRRGGGAYLVGNATLNHCVVFENRTMDDHAGGVRGGTLNDCTIRNNFAGGTNSEGGGVSESTLNRCLVLNNSARFGAGAAFSTLNHCLVRGNQASASVGGAYYGTLNHCTVIENSAAEQAGGTGAAVVNNSIVYFNTAASSPNHGFCEFSHTCTTPLPSEGAGNIDSPPVFAGAANFRLAESSPCRDAGDNAQVVGVVDLDGKPRIYNDVTDMGCYELQMGEGYWEWAESITNGLIQPGDSAAGDGFENLMNYATGRSAMTPDMQPRANFALMEGGPGLSFVRNTLADDVTITVEASDDLSSGWTTIATNQNGSWGGALNVSESGTGTTRVVEVEDTEMEAYKRFFRMKVTRP